MLRPKLDTDHAQDMPALYFERTSAVEQERHRGKLQRVALEGGLLIDALQDPESGDWLIEVVTVDWDEPGLLDRLFEAILRCHRLEGGISIRRARIFTGERGQVVNLLELRDRENQPLSQEAVEVVLERLREIRPGERGVLDTIQNYPYRTLIPQVTEFPFVDNSVSDAYTCLDVHVERVSNRFTSLLLHALARSELWVSVQVAEFIQEERGLYRFFVTDKNGHKLKDSARVRKSLVRMVESVSDMLTRFNVQYLRREWQQRIEANGRTVYHSRPDFEDFLRDIANIRTLAELKGFDPRLSYLVEAGLLTGHDFFFLKKVEAFVQSNLTRAREMVQGPPGEADVELCREYFAYRRRSLRILTPLFERLAEMPPVRDALTPQLKLSALCRPLSGSRFAIDADLRLHLEGSLWLGKPIRALEPFHLLARTDCYLRSDTLDAIEACLEGWDDLFIQEHREELGARFLAVLDESVHQGNTAMVLRNMRAVGLLERFLPGFAQIEGRIHMSADHAYTVDEHSFLVIEALLGLRLLGEVLPATGTPPLRADYSRLQTASGLKNYALKYAVEIRTLEHVTPLRNHTAMRDFFQLMRETRDNSLDYVVEANLLEYGYDTCMLALMEIEEARKRLDPLIRLFTGLPFSTQRVLVLAGLMHDLKKPAQDHDALGADFVATVLEGTGLRLPEADVERLRWLVANHLGIKPLLHEVGSKGEDVVAGFVERSGEPGLFRDLVLFTFADRVALRQDLNAQNHDAMVLAQMLDMAGIRAS